MANGAKYGRDPPAVTVKLMGTLELLYVAPFAGVLMAITGAEKQNLL